MKRLQNPIKPALLFARRNRRQIIVYIDRFLPAEIYLNVSISDHASGISRGPVMVLLPNANFSNETAASEVHKFVSAAKYESDIIPKRFLKNKNLLTTLTTIVGKPNSSPQGRIGFADNKSLSFNKSI